MTAIKLSKDGTHYIKDGRIYSRVSDIAGAGEKPWLEAWKKRVGIEETERIAKETAEYGELVHEITMYSDTKKYRAMERMLGMVPEMEKPLIMWEKWVSNYIDKWILIEQIVWSNKWMAAGRIDRVGIIKGDRHATIVDIKTGSLNNEIGIQIYGGYVPIYNEWRKNQKRKLPIATRALAVNLPRNDPAAIHIKDYTKSKYLDEFESKAELFRSMNK